MTSHAKVYDFYFRKRNGSLVRFGPYEYEGEARISFQWKYGYWPEPAEKRIEFVKE